MSNRSFEPLPQTLRFPAVFDSNFGKIPFQFVCPELYELEYGTPTKSEVLFYAFNHSAGRFQHALGVEKFRNFLKQYPNKTIIILEFGVGDENSAHNNPQELTLFNLDGNQYKVIKFWYDIDFKFSAKTCNDDSREILQDLICKLK